MEVTYEREPGVHDLILVVSDTRHLMWLLKCKKNGIPIVQRLDGIHWHNREKTIFSRSRLREHARNKIMQFIRNHVADHVIYQSEFIKDFWNVKHGPTPVPHSVIHNGVDTDLFSPDGGEMIRNQGITLITVEGSLSVERIIKTPLDVWRYLVRFREDTHLLLVGELSERLRHLLPEDSRVQYLGTMPNHKLPCYIRGSSVFLSAELNPPCPNSVIEALACGVPVVGFASGALPELVPDSAGVCVDYGADPWKFEEPDIPALGEAVMHVMSDYSKYSSGARNLANERYDVNHMAASYAEVFRNIL